MRAVFLSAALAVACAGSSDPERGDVATCDPGACPARSGDPEGLRLGTNPFSEAAFSRFAEIAPGAEVEAVLGPQHAWMIVAAAAVDTFDCCTTTGRVVVDLVRTEDAVSLVHFDVPRHALPDAGGGTRYLPDMLLVLGSSEDWRDREVELTVSIEPDAGGPAETASVRFTIRGTTPPAPGG